MKIAMLVGSLRKESYNLKMANALITLAPKEFEIEKIEIGNLPFYNQDLEDSNVPETWKNFREKIKSCDGVIFVTPEYNRSVPAVLKNAVDVGSRPPANDVWKGKPACVISVSPGAAGGMAANHHLRQSLMAVDLHVMSGPEAYIGKAADLFDAENKFKDEKTKAFIQKFMDSYVAWVKKSR